MFVIIFFYRVIEQFYPSQREKNHNTKLTSQIINNPRANVVTIVNNLTSLREVNRLELHDGCSKPDKFEPSSSHLIYAVNITSLPPKIWRPKPKNNYNPMVCTDDDESLYIFKHCGKTMKRTPLWTPKPRKDLIPQNYSFCQQELDDSFNIDYMTDNFTCQVILQLIKDNWDYFCEV